MESEADYYGKLHRPGKMLNRRAQILREKYVEESIISSILIPDEQNEI